MKTDVENKYQKNLEEEKRRRRRRTSLVFGFVVLILLLGSLGGWYLLSGKGTQRRYEETLDEGNRYLIQLDYAAAELCYKKAIEAVPDQPEAYEKLANVYIAQSRYEEAGQLLVKGIRSTNAEPLLKTYQRVSEILRNLQDSGLTADGITAEQLNRISEGLTLDSTIYDIVASYLYSDYVEAFGEPISSADNSYGGQEMRFDGFAGNVSFRTASYEERRADAVSFENLSDLLGNYGGAASAEKLQELYGSEKKLTVSESESETRYYVSFTYHGCVVTFACDENGNVYGNAANVVSPDPETASLREPEDAGEASQGQRRVSGYIINAVNGGGVTASVRFLSGGRYGRVECETSTHSDGSFEVELSPGQYTVEIRATGFITSYEEIIVTAAVDLKGLSFALSPELETGEIRIVLTWGAQPRDLDSHLEGTGSGGERVDISFRNMKTGNIASLDIDDVSGYGPETTTIYDAGGSYTFKVHNYSASYDSARLDQSGAVVKIYLSGQAEPIVYEVPSGNGTWWSVCEIKNGAVTPINTIY